MKKRTFLESLNDAVEGFVYVIRQEQNMRVHFLFAFFVLLLAIFLGVSRIEWIILSSVVTFVLVAEMINTAIEETLDLVHGAFHPVARIIKHISAGVVLVTVVNSIIVGFFIFSRYLRPPFELAVHHLRYSTWHLAFVSTMVAIFIVISGKAFLGKGTPFRGGPVSGHTAVAFSLWTVVLFTQTNRYAVALSFLLAALVGQSRLRSKIHSFWEVVAGAFVGFGVTALFFKLFG
jgi:diacylglycerol kinase (ATP)